MKNECEAAQTAARDTEGTPAASPQTWRPGPPSQYLRFLAIFRCTPRCTMCTYSWHRIEQAYRFSSACSDWPGMYKPATLPSLTFRDKLDIALSLKSDLCEKAMYFLYRTMYTLTNPEVEAVSTFTLSKPIVEIDIHRAAHIVEFPHICKVFIPKTLFYVDCLQNLNLPKLH